MGHPQTHAAQQALRRTRLHIPSSGDIGRPVTSTAECVADHVRTRRGGITHSDVDLLRKRYGIVTSARATSTPLPRHAPYAPALTVE
jgi:hypothetical protein